MSDKKRLFLIDGNSFCYRAFYAIRSLVTSRGEPTNAVYGFITMMNKIVDKEKPDYLAVTFDLKGPTFRHKKFDDYKIHRKPMPDELVSQLPVIKDVLAGYRIPIFEMEGFEADDLLATIARKAEAEDIETFIVTGDKDALQLVGSHIKVYNTHKDGMIYDSDKVKERFGVGPERVVDIMALAGDATDNIPGVPGIGEKTAIKLIVEFGSLDGLLDNLDKVKGEGLKKKLMESKDLARMSEELARLDAAVPIKVSFEDLKPKPHDTKKLLTLFKRLEFRGLFKELAPTDTLKSDYRLIEDEKGFAGLIKELGKSEEFVFDFETTGKDPMLAEIVGISFCWKKGLAYYVGTEDKKSFKTEKKKLDTKDVLAKLKPMLEDPKIKKVGQNIKYEAVILQNYGIKLKGISFDTMVGSYLLNPSKPNHNLDDISLEYLGHKMIPLSDLMGSGKNKITMDKVGLDRICEYSCEDSDVTFRLKEIFIKELSKKALDKLFDDVEVPLIDVLKSVELNGVAIDKKFLSELSETMDRSLGKLTKDVYDIAGCEFNINSPKQLSEILFDKLKLPVVRRTKTGFSTDEGVLRTLAAKHALPTTLIEFRELSKLKSTYVDALPKLINPKTGRVHTSFNQAVTATGRLSSSSPNLQNIPIKTELGRKIRKAFVPSDPKALLVSADYSQIELRILAHLSKDKDLIHAFKEGLDIHTHTASLVFGVEMEQVTSEMRSQAKVVNFGIIYGMSAWGLARDLEISPEEAGEFIDNYFQRYPGVKSFLEETIEAAREDGFVTTMMKRRRYLPEIKNDNMSLRQFAERTAVNTPIQGSAADLIKVAMIEVDRELASGSWRSKMILQVHDELVFEVPQQELKDLKAMIKEKMENAIKLDVPIEVNVKAGKNWLETK